MTAWLSKSCIFPSVREGSAGTVHLNVQHFFFPVHIFIFGYAGSLLLLRPLSSCSEGGYSPVSVLQLLTVVASLVPEHRL